MTIETSSTRLWRQMAARKKVLLPVLLFSVLTIWFTCGWLVHRFSHVEEADAKVVGEMIKTASRVNGWIVKKYVIEGDHVVKGQVLCELDKRDAELRLKELESNVDAHIAQIRQLTAQRDMVKLTIAAQIDNAEASLRAACSSVEVVTAKVKLARSEFARAEQLVGSMAISRQAWDTAQSSLRQQEASLRQAEDNVSTQKATLALALAQEGQVAVLEQQMEAARGELAALEAKAAQVRQEIADRTLCAPVDGVVDRTFINNGDYVTAGQWLLIMHDAGNEWVEANIKETAVGKLRVGQPVKISIDAYPDRRFTGKVFRIGNAATNQFALLPSPNPSGNFTKITQRVPVRITFDEPAEVQPGLMVEVSINVSH